METAFSLSHKHGAGTLIGHTNGYVYRISDYSPGTGEAYGHPVDAVMSGREPGCYFYGNYQRIPDGICTLIRESRS